MSFRSPCTAISSIAVLLFLLLASSLCSASGLAFEAGRTLLHGETKSIAVSVSFGHQRNIGHDLQNFNYECGLFYTATVGVNPDNLGAQCLVVDSFRYIDVGIGGAYLKNTDAFNGSHLNFALLLRWKFSERLAITLDNHISNAGTVLPNIGRDMLRIRWVMTK